MNNHKCEHGFELIYEIMQLKNTTYNQYSTLL